ncbi:MAG: hypothetical protein ABI277_14770 [Burkholderiaceae bacterium]
MSSSSLRRDPVLPQTAIAAFVLRGLKGFDTRDIATVDSKSMPAITCHFGGKEGLREACDEHIASAFDRQIEPSLAAPEALCTDDRNSDAARMASLAIFDGLATTMVRDETAASARCIVRDEIARTNSFEILWKAVMGYAVLDQLAAGTSR